MIDSLYSLLGKLGFTDPLHTPIVHIPIGLVIGAFVLFVVALLFKRERLVVTARHLSILAFVFVFPTILFGVFDWIHFFHGAMIPAIKVKMLLAGILLVFLGIGIVLGGEAKPHRIALLIVYFCSFLLVVGLGYFGASLVFRHVEVAAQSPGIGVSEPPSSSPTSKSPPAKGESASEIGSEGAAIFQANCVSCHPGGSNIIEASLPIKGSKRLAALETFQGFVRAPTMPDGKAGAMPPFGESAISVDQVRELYSYLRTAFK